MKFVTMPLMPTNNCNRNIWKHPSKRKFNIYHKISSKGNYVYLLECLLCKIQYVGKSETCFHIRLNNHRSPNPHSIEACKHFIKRNQVFHQDGKFTLIELLNNIKNTSRIQVLKQRLKDRQNHWIKRLKTVTPFDLNQELN